MYCGFENYVLSSQLTKQIVFTTRRIIYIMFDIITDSACDIVREYAETHNLKLVPLYTTFDGVNYLKALLLQRHTNRVNIMQRPGYPNCSIRL